MATPNLSLERSERTPELAAQLAAIDRKLDRLALQVDHLYARTRAMEELKDELMPVARDAMGALQDELGALEHEFNTRELAYLVRKLLRNTPRFIRLLDRLESLDSLISELEPLGKEVVHGAVDTLAQAEARGWFQLLDRLGRPEVVALANASLETLQAPGPRARVGMFGAMRALRDPEVQEGVGLLLELLRQTARTTKSEGVSDE